MYFMAIVSAFVIYIYIYVVITNKTDDTAEMKESPTELSYTNSEKPTTYTKGHNIHVHA